MRTENIHGFSSILLAFALVLSMAISMTFTATPALAGGTISTPGGTTINVIPNQEFTLQFKLYWDEPANLGYFSLGIYWDSPKINSSGTANENFTFVSASAYFENGDPITVGTTFSEGVSPSDPTKWRHSVVVDHTIGDGGDDNFYVDIVMRAQGAGGVGHIAPDTHIIYISGTVDVAESTIVSYSPPDPNITIQVNAWTGGVVLSGKANANNDYDGGGMPAYVDYGAGDLPPIMVAQTVDSGAVVAGGISSSLRDGRWNDTDPTNPQPHLDNLLDAAFQWMVPGAENVLWWNQCYNNTTEASYLVAALEALGYTVDGDDRALENMYSGFTIPGYIIPPGTLVENLPSIDDQYAIENDPTSAGYDSTDVHIGRFTYEDNDRAFIKWDLTGLSATATSISSATLILQTYWDPDNDMTAGFYVCDDAWNEDNLSWDNMPTTGITGDTDFNDAFTFATEWDAYSKDNFDFIGWHSDEFGLGLFISEYIEGSSYNKAIEIYNGTGATVDLSAYKLGLWSNGKVENEGYPKEYILSGTLNSGDVWVGCHKSADAAILAVADWIEDPTNVTNWNGDDGITLRRISDNAVIDAIGQYGYDPNGSWPGGGKDQTQVRTSQISTIDMTQESYAYWRTLDVTSYVQSEFASDNVVSIMIKSENEDLPMEEAHSCQFAAKESFGGANGPFLEITYLGEETVVDEVVYDKGLENYDIFVMGQLQVGSKYTGGDPDLVTATAVSVIDTWVRGGGGLLITEGGDYSSYNYCRVQNKFLDALDFGWWFQHDQVRDDVDNWGALYEIVVDVDTTTAIGILYSLNTPANSGEDNLGVYSTSTMVELPVSFSVDVAVGPAVVSQPENTTVTVNVTVTNLGAGDEFSLSVSDDLGWNPQISTSYVDLGVGESDGTITASVDIPVGTAYCTYNTVYVTATSVTDNTVSDVGTANAHSLGAPLDLRGVTVEIHPEHQEAELVIDYDAVKKRYDPLTFKVIVTNTGDLWDKYVLEATTDSDKILELWPTELFLQPGQSDFVVLSVTVPEDEIGSNLNEIRVDAYGTFATFTGDDMGNAAGFDTCTVHIAEAYCVRVDVWPFQVQSATPGSKVRWIARVKNLGNVPNTYQIDVTNVVMDANRVYEPANIVVEPYIVELPPCTWEQVIIDLDVPEGLEMSTRIYVTVHVYSLIYEGCEDTKEVEVHVVRGIPPIPQGVIKLEVETEIIAIQVWPTYWDFGVMDEAEIATSGIFTVRNIGNEPVDVTIAGNDAKSSPGELTTTWELDSIGTVGLDRYAMWYDSTILTTAGSLLVGNLPVSAEHNFDLTLQAPSSITVPSRMWTLVNLTAVEA